MTYIEIDLSLNMNNEVRMYVKYLTVRVQYYCLE